MKVLFPFLAVALLVPWFVREASGAAMLADAEGVCRVVIDGVDSSGSGRVDSVLPPGTVVSTGDDGRAVVELAPGIVIELESSTQIIIGEITQGGEVDPLGNPIPQVSVTLSVGTIVVVASESGFLTSSLVIATPRGNISPAEASRSAVTVTGIDPTTATVTIISAAGSMLAITTSNEQVPVAEGLGAILVPDGSSTVLPAMNIPGGAAVLQSIQAAGDRITSLNNLTPAVPPPVEPAVSAQPDTPVNQPRIAPSPSPTPTPTPTPTPPPPSL